MKKEKPEIVDYNGKKFRRILLKTAFLSKDDKILEICKKYFGDIIQPSDIVMFAETPVATMQGRAIDIKDIKVGILAKLLWQRVYKSPYGIGLRSPWTMQMAIQEVGGCRILYAAVASVIGKLFGKRGVFYKIAGPKAATIDAAGTSPLYPTQVVLGPDKPDNVCKQVEEAFACKAVIMDINDIGGCEILGKSPKMTDSDCEIMKFVMKDNPCGQSDELTPICIVRPE